MKLFSKRKNQTTRGTLSDHISVYLDNRQRKVAQWLNGKTVGISKKKVAYGLLAFCLLVGSYLIYVMVSAFN